MSDATENYCRQLRERREELLKELALIDNTLAAITKLMSGEQLSGDERPEVGSKKPVHVAVRNGKKKRVVATAEQFRQRILSALKSRRTWVTKWAVYDLMTRQSPASFANVSKPYSKVSVAMDVLCERGDMLRQGDFYGLDTFYPYDSPQNTEAMRRLRTEGSKRRSVAAVHGWSSRRDEPVEAQSVEGETR